MSRSGSLACALLCGSLALAGCRASDPAEPGWVVTDAGVGPIRVGMTADDVRPYVETLGGLEACVYAKVDASRVPAAPGSSPQDRQPALLVMLLDGKVVRVDVITAGIPTAAGARVGDTEQRVRDLYPDVRTEPHKYTDGHYLVVESNPGRRLVFETDGARVTRYRAGAIPQVDWVEGCS
jgi:hypothetical protein